MSTFVMRANKGVMSVAATAPITSTGGTVPVLSISAATTSAAGSMSAADKTKIDSITVGAADTLDGVHAADLRVFDGWIGNPGIDANAMAVNKVGFTYQNNAPYTGPIINFGGNAGNGYPLQINTSYSAATALAYRTKNGDTGAWNAWQYLSTTAHAHTGTYSAIGHTHTAYAPVTHAHNSITKNFAWVGITESEHLQLQCTLPEYLGNVTAKAGGLVDGDVYRTGDLLKVVHS